MYLENPRSVERDNQNALRKYPFADSSGCGNSACAIPPGALVDAQLYVPGRSPGRVWLSLVDEGGVLHFSDGAGEFARTVAPVSPMTAVPVSFTGDGGPLPGGVVVCGSQASVGALLQVGRQEFSADDTELASAAVTFTGARGVLGFRLDDGSVVWGDVRIRGANGCDVATYVGEDGVRYLRISAVGQAVSTSAVTGFIRKVIADSDNSNFTVAPSDATPNRIIQVMPVGANFKGDDDIPSDQEDACSAVRRARGTLPSGSATVPPDCGSGICGGELRYHAVRLWDGDDKVAETRLLEGAPLGVAVKLPSKPGKRFVGYFKPDPAAEGSAKQYYRADGRGVGVFSDTEDVDLYAHWMPGRSEAEVSLSGYGTLHIVAPDTINYSNPLLVSGSVGVVPAARSLTPSDLADGGSEALADIILHPITQPGEVRLSLRGLRKAFDS